MFELARRHGKGPVRISDIAAAQAIPIRFLEVILSQLRRGGLVQSRRGVDGGYLLAQHPARVKVGEIIQLIEGPLNPVSCMSGRTSEECALRDNCVFIQLWKRAEKAVGDVYDLTSLQDLLDDDAIRQHAAPLTYAI
jgi:Rrf2 family protein